MMETTRFFGAHKHLVGTFTEPEAHQPASGSVMVLLTNAGVISRSGPHRINVLLARRFSALGLRSLRWDLSGLGDSARPAQALPMYEQFVADTRAAMDEAQRMYGVSRFIMIGFCSGAEVAYYTALKDERLIGLALFALFFAAFVFYAPNLLGHPDNYIPANPLQTPPSSHSIVT